MDDQSKNVRDILMSIGYTNLVDCGSYYRTKPLYRFSDNPTSLSINKTTGIWKDFARNIGGDLAKLIALTTGDSNWGNIKKVLENFNPETIDVKLESPKIFSKSNLDLIKKDYSYWNARGISDGVLDKLDCGVVSEAKMAKRFVFPIYNRRGDIYGFSGRLIESPNEFSPKWKHIGQKKFWSYPLFLSEDFCKEEIILVESVGDMLSLFEIGFFNVIVLFGVSISREIFNNIIRINPDKITIILNNDSQNNSVGNKAAVKIKEKLSNVFSKESVNVIDLPYNDLNDFLIKGGQEDLKSFLIERKCIFETKEFKD